MELRANAVKATGESPLRLSRASDIDWHECTEVVVVGFGAAGACTALEAAANGARVTLLDRLSGGGASALSGGVVYAGGGTTIQQQAGEQDSVDNMFAYLQQEVQGAVSDDTLRDFCEKSAANLAWLESHGAHYDAKAYDEKTSYPPDGYFLYYSGNETSAPYRHLAQPVRRGHRTKGRGLTGRVLLGALRNSIEKNTRISVKVHTEVRRLITDGDNRVLGVEVLAAPTGCWMRYLMDQLNKLGNAFIMLAPGLGKVFRSRVHALRARGSVRRLRAERGVVLCTGGFIANREMVKKYAPAYTGVRPLGEDCHGSGILLGHSVGGALKYMDRVSAWRFFSPPACLIEGLMVGADGRRLCNEDLYGATTADHLVRHSKGKGWLLVDQALFDRAKTEARPGSMPWNQWLPARLLLHTSVVKAGSIAQLAGKIDLDAEALQQVVTRFNRGCTRDDDEFDKLGKYLRPLGEGPYYAMNISIGNAKVPCLSMTLGGLVVDEHNGQVKNADGKVIAGLYAAGRSAVGLCSQSYISGLSLADCVYSGRRAGAHCIGCD